MIWSGLSIRSVMCERLAWMKSPHSTETGRADTLEEDERASLHDLFNAWISRESDFSFMESAVAPADPEVALEVMQLFRRVERLCNAIEQLQSVRCQEGLPELPDLLLVWVNSIEELTLVETLVDEGVVDLLSSLVSGDDEDERSASLLNALFEQCRQDCVRFVQAIQMEISEQSRRPRETELLEHAYQAWRHSWQVDRWDEAIEWMGERGERAAEPLWGELIEPFYLEELGRSLANHRLEGALKQIQEYFERLIDAKRPKDQRVAGIWIDEEHPSRITVMFVTRGGKLLAQRDLLWVPEEPESILNSFSEINIHTLAVPDEFRTRYPDAFKALKRKYNVALVLSGALDEVKHPPNLECSAQKALRIGQRLVAPLRFYIRADLPTLLASIVPESLMELVADHDAKQVLFDRLQDSCSLRWLKLRHRRQRQEASHEEQTRKSKFKDASPQKNSPQDLHITKGALLKAHFQTLIGHTIEVSLDTQPPRRGRIKLSGSQYRRLSMAETSEWMKDGFMVIVIGEDLKSDTLLLRWSEESDEDREEAEVEDDTLTRLDALFPSKKR